MALREFDLVVLGGGTGGYVAAIRAAQLGKKVAVVEKDKLGGTCLHRGCIPSKSLLRSAEMFAAMKRADTYGIEATSVRLDFEKVNERKNRIVEQLHQGIQTLMRKNQIEVIYGEGRVMGPSIFSPQSGAIAIQDDVDDPAHEGTILVPRHLIIATGSRPRLLPGWESDGERVLTSDDALKLKKLPSSILIIGGGVIGVEWASMLNDFGVKVTLVEAAERLVPTEDEAISKQLQNILEKRGVIVYTHAEIQPDSKQVADDGVRVAIRTKDKEHELFAECVLLSVGRVPNTQHLGLENTAVKFDISGIDVNKYMQTAEPHIYAIGDCTGGIQLAHAAMHQGIIAVEHMAGLETEPFVAERVPRCIYTRPEIASVGMTERKAREAGFDVKTGTFPFSAIGKAWVYGETDGFVKVIADRKSGDLLGVHIIGPQATDLIAEAALAQLLDAAPWEVAGTIHPHPTLSEAIAEAMLALDKKSIGI